jgi:hypothetical protein
VVGGVSNDTDLEVNHQPGLRPQLNAEVTIVPPLEALMRAKPKTLVSSFWTTDERERLAKRRRSSSRRLETGSLYLRSAHPRTKCNEVRPRLKTVCNEREKTNLSLPRPVAEGVEGWYISFKSWFLTVSHQDLEGRDVPASHRLAPSTHFLFSFSSTTRLGLKTCPIEWVVEEERRKENDERPPTNKRW